MMETRPVRRLTVYFLAWKVLLLLVIVGCPGPGYDTSTTLLGVDTANGKGVDSSLPWFLRNLVRWDSIYFLKTAERGYRFEQEWAFGYGYSRLLSYLALVLSDESAGIAPVAWVGIVLSHLCHYLSVLVLYSMSKRVLAPDTDRNNRIAFLSAALHIICPAGAFLSAPYGEPVFSFLNFTGFYLYVSALSDDRGRDWFRRDAKFLLAGALFAAATSIRSNGVLSGILFAYDALLGLSAIARNDISLSSIRRLFFIFAGGSLIMVGLVGPQYVAYREYCQSTDVPRTWCSNMIPSIYTWVQSRYWGVGFLKYWTLSNVPLFILATPMLLMLIWSSLWALSVTPLTPESTVNARSDHLQACLSRLALPQAVLALLALTGYHVQIITRISSGYPLWYWYIAFQTLSESNTSQNRSSLFQGGIFVRGMVLYAIVQGALFGSFLPPA